MRKSIFVFLFLVGTVLQVCADGASVETARWQSAIDTAAKAGGVVTIPPGRHLVGQLDLKSNVELHLEKGAVLEGVVGLEHYRVTTLPYSEGTWSAIVSAIGVTNVAITGEGEIFGNGGAWPRPKGLGGNQEGQRARGVFFADSRDIRLEGISLRDAACWGVVFKCCENVTVRKVRVDSHANANNDGFDIEAKNVLVEDCDVDTDDDAFCIKSNDPNFVVENVRIRNCHGRSHCYMFKVGTASHGTVRDVRFENCRAENPRRSNDRKGQGVLPASSPRFLPGYPNGGGVAAMAVENVDGGIVEDVAFDRISFTGVHAPIFIRGGSRSGRPCGTPANDKYVFRNISIENAEGDCAGKLPSAITGVDACRIHNVTLRNVSVLCRGADRDASLRAKTEPVPYKPRGYPCLLQSFSPHILPAFGLYVDRVDNIRLDNVRFQLRAEFPDARPAVAWGDVTGRVGLELWGP